MTEKDSTLHTPAEGVRILGAAEAASDQATPTHDPIEHDEVRQNVDVDLTSSEEHGMQHWADEPTGSVPIVIGDSELPSSEDELNTGPVWRDHHSRWESDESSEISDIDHESVRVGAIAEDTYEPNDPFTESTPVEPQRKQPTVPITTRVPNAPLYDEENQVQKGAPVNSRVTTGFAIAIVAAIAFYLGAFTIIVLATALVVLATAEAYDAMRRIGLKPASLIGVVASASLMISAYSRGEVALPIVMSLTILATLVWFLFRASPGRPVVSSAATLFGVMWPGLLGAFVGLILRMPNEHGVGLLLGAVAISAIYDIGAFVVGRQMGHRKLMESVSPGKTVEGAIGGTVIAIIASVIIFSNWTPWDNIGNALALGIIVSIFAPLGDLCESMIKRDLGIKDMGTWLPGHGGILDRVDSILFVLPAVFYLSLALHIV